MKKILVCMALAMTVFTIQSYAQPGGNRGERMKQMLKDSVGLSDVQIDTVMAVRQEFQPQIMGIYQDQTLSDDDKKVKIADLALKMRARYKGTLTDDQITKLEAYQQRQMERMRNRRGGGGGNQK